MASSQAEAKDVFGRANALHEERLLHLWHEHGDHRFDGAFSAESVLAKGNNFVGTVGSVRDEIVAQVEASGVNYLELKIIFGDIAFGDAVTTARTITEHVAPAARDAAGRAARRPGLPVD